MNNIDDIIRKHKAVFDDAEPSEGHFERFRNKLAGETPPVRKVNIGSYLLRVAAVTIMVTLSSLYLWEHFIRPESRGMTLSQVSPQYREVEDYFIRQVNLLEREIISISPEPGSEQKKILNDEMKLMDTTYKELQKELKANPNDERIINAMIEHYQAKVEVMLYILNQLKEIQSANQKKNNGNEEFSL